MPIGDKNIKINLSLGRLGSDTTDTRSRLPERREKEKESKTYRDRSPITAPKPVKQKEDNVNDTGHTKTGYLRNLTDERIPRYTNKDEISSEQEKAETEEHSEAHSEKELDNTEVDREIAQIMGFSGFGSTNGNHVQGAKGGGTKIENTSQYRRYMNRKKGFNRPLSPTR